MTNVAHLRKLQRSPVAWRSAVRIDASGSARPCADALDPFQTEDFAALDAAILRTIGQGDGPTRCWLERPRGHSKTTDLALVISYALFASRRRLAGVAAAADQEQAALLRDAVSKLVQLNPWLGKFVEVQKHVIRNPHTESELRILSSDAPSSYGITPDLVIADELTHWRDRSLWDSLLSSAAKRDNCALVVITNAGQVGSWQHETRSAIRESPAWYFRALAGPTASWITEPRLDEQRRLLPPKVYARLWLNQWQDGTGDALDNVDTAITLTGPSAPERGYGYVAGLDIGISRDATALAVLGVHTGWTETHTAATRHLSPTMAALVDHGFASAPRPETTRTHHPGNGRLRLADLHVWKPDGNRVDLEHVERTILDLHDRYRFAALAVDPWQSELLQTRLRRAGVPIYEVPQTGSNCQATASAVLDAFNENVIDLYPHAELIPDLKALRIVERSYGYRLESPRRSDAGTAHGDTASALGLAMLAAKRFTPRTTWKVGRLVCHPSAA